MGQSADVSVDALPGKIFKGHITEVGDQALLRSTGVATSQSTTGTEEAKDFKVIVTLDPGQEASDLRPGLSATAKITTAHKASVLSLPLQALTPAPASDGSKVEAASSGPPKQGVFVIRTEKGKLHAHFVPLITGMTGTTNIEVGGDLHDGDEIVTGSYKTLRGLKDGSLVKRTTIEASAGKPEGN
jgi:HlyD family secretion protein